MANRFQHFETGKHVLPLLMLLQYSSAAGVMTDMKLRWKIIDPGLEDKGLPPAKRRGAFKPTMNTRATTKTA